MSASEPLPVPDDNAWPQMSAEEEAELRRDFTDAEEEYKRGECIPRDEVLPRLRRAG